MTGHARVFALFLLYSLITATLFQQVVIPILLSHQDMGNRILRDTDSMTFHRFAAEMAERMQKEGWSAWQLKPGREGLPVGTTAIFYYLFGPSPWIILPLNALLHAGAAFVLAIILSLILSPYSPTLAPLELKGVCGAIPFLVFPSSLSWVAQIHRDGFTILGCFLFLLGGLQLMRKDRLIPAALSLIFGSTLMHISRFPTYVLCVYLFYPTLIAAILLAIYQKRSVKFIVGIVAIGLMVWKVFPSTSIEVTPNHIVTVRPDGTLHTKNYDRWEPTPYLPQYIDNKISILGSQRRSFVLFNRNKATQIDTHVLFNNAFDVVQYLPRALQISIGAPFPYAWFGSGTRKGSPQRRALGAIEMSISYFFLICAFTSVLFFWRSPPYWAATFWCLAHLSIIGLTVNYLGALYRYRYAFLLLLVGLGILCFTKMVEHFRTPKTRPSWKRLTQQLNA